MWRLTTRRCERNPVPSSGPQGLCRAGRQREGILTRAAEGDVIVRCKDTAAAPDLHVVTEVAGVLDRRAALKHPPVTLAISDAVALGIAGIFRSSTPSGRVLERFYRSGSGDSVQLIEAARTEQRYA